jgi:transposase-like protein
MKKCPHCGHGLVKNGLNPSGSQKYLCRQCGRVSTPSPTPVGVDPQVKRRALQLVLDGTGFRAAARQVGVAHSAVLAWFKDLADATPATPAKPSGAPEQVELDELFTFVHKKKTKSS